MRVRRGSIVVVGDEPASSPWIEAAISDSRSDRQLSFAADVPSFAHAVGI